MSDRDARWTAEALRLNARYATEVVEPLELCPFARHARKSGRVKNIVLLQRTADVAPALAAIDELVAGPREVEIAQLIFPRLAIGATELEWFQAELRNADAAVRPGEPVFVMAAFHPQHRLDASSPERLVPFLRRTPDPTIQLLRFSRIQQLRDESGRGTSFFDIEKLSLDALPDPPAPDLTTRIAQNNLATVTREGIERVAALLEDIRADRERTYATLATDE
jgi:hypothetical protein